MQVIVQISSGPAAGRKFFLRGGQTARIGRTEWAEFSVPEDESLADVHFELDCTTGSCRLRNLDSKAKTLLAGKPATDTALTDGARITAGKTEFVVVIEEETLDAGTSGEIDGEQPADPAENPPPGVKEICENLDLSDEALELLDDELTPQAFLAVLVEGKLFGDAFPFLAQWLPKREAVWWASRSVRAFAGETLTDQDATLLNAAEQWVIDPSEENRRAAESAANAAGLDTPAAWPAMAAFWSGGSIAPPDLEAVPPAKHLTGVAASTAVTIAFAALPADSKKTVVERGLQIAAGEDRWPPKE